MITDDSVSAALRQVELDPRSFPDRQRIRDVPRSCICPWTWGRPVLRWVRLYTDFNCPWHSRAPWYDVREVRAADVPDAGEQL